MSKEQKIIYEPHPVTAERKAELRAEGYTIIDAVYAPANALRDGGPTIAEYVAAGYQAANYPPKGFESRSTPEEIAEAVAGQAEGKADKPLTVPQIKAALAEKGVEIPEGVTKRDDLLALLVGNQGGKPADGE